ncbi:MaoC family dehydratase [Alteromonas sp. NFXS44]|uniref:MaoC family dehydratase n=1 Tax=Alteromonas sp. NFXS44 TaxID=2818435 RepID=UPI0032DFF646
MTIQNRLKSIPLIISLSLGTLLSTGSVQAYHEQPHTDKALIEETAFESEQYVDLYPGLFTVQEKQPIGDYIKMINAINQRGDVDIKALIKKGWPKSVPGLGNVIEVTPEWVAYQNNKYDPTNPLYTDKKYAKAHGHPDTPAYLTFGIHDDSFMTFPNVESRDSLLAGDLNHNVTFYRHVYPGDTLYVIKDQIIRKDRTPEEGSKYRWTHNSYSGRVFNQNAEKVADVTFRVTRGIKIFKDEFEPEKRDFKLLWEAPAWNSRPAHYYTDADWTYIKSIWQNESVQGSKPLYWEQVKIGDRPTVTADGPILHGPLPISPHGMGVGGSVSLQRFIMDPKIAKTMIRNSADGIYRMKNRTDYVPIPPGSDKPIALAMSEEDESDYDVTDIHKESEKRAILLNYVARDFAIRHINNWMGDKGFVQNLRWSIMDPRAMALVGKTIPENPEAEHFLDRVPELKGKHVNTHGLTQDMAIVKSYVYDKYVENNKHYIEIVWWIENIEGDIWQEGAATIELPSIQD